MNQLPVPFQILISILIMFGGVFLIVLGIVRFLRRRVVYDDVFSHWKIFWRRQNSSMMLKLLEFVMLSAVGGLVILWGYFEIDRAINGMQVLNLPGGMPINSHVHQKGSSDLPKLE